MRGRVLTKDVKLLLTLDKRWPGLCKMEMNKEITLTYFKCHENDTVVSGQ